jgi:hypothetical protein
VGIENREVRNEKLECRSRNSAIRIPHSAFDLEEDRT